KLRGGKHNVAFVKRLWAPGKHNWTISLVSDTDECNAGSHCCQQGCYNYPGGYECVCYAGYLLNPTGCGCDDVDECSANNGGCEHLCRNLVGSFLCSCRIGFKLGEDRRSCLGE
ncbi:PREDICTED: multiple epidermal growth factor-like domains protein 6, partial [Thamnophis sirtalis]|uniref:Multiple epidermal growth factor-like domains protein 6 n=1 Tax=Thamnophis sirtalis TaxID=35019 RepID=A0A6I9YVE0_9SAUR